MGKDTVLANGRSAAGNHTLHVARVMPAGDLCWIAGLEFQAAAPFPNEIASEHLDTGATTHTNIGGEPVWTAQGLLDGVDSNFDDPDKSFGVVSFTRNKEAEPLTWSPDVIFEGFGVVRDKDLTFQNHRNSLGLVNGPPLQIDVDVREKYQAKMCAVTALHGHCGHGRPLGYVPGTKQALMLQPGKPAPVRDGNYLEVVSTWAESMTFTVDYQNLALPEPGPGECLAKAKVHPEWMVTRAGGPVSTSSAVGKLPGVFHDHITQTTKIKVGGPMSPMLVFDNPISVAGLGLRLLPFLWRWKEEAPIVTVQVTGCSGVNVAVIRVLPTDHFRFTLGSETNWLVKNRLVKGVADRITAFFKRFSILELEFASSPAAKLTFDAQFRELSENRNGHTWVEANLDWKLSAGLDPIIGLKARRKLPILRFLGAIGYLAEKIGDAFGLEGAFEIGFDVGISLVAMFACNEYRQITGPVEASAKFEPLLALKVLAAKNELSAQLSLEAKYSFVFTPSRKSFIELTPKGEIQGIFKVSVKRADKSLATDLIHKRPKWANAKWPGTPIAVFGR